VSRRSFRARVEAARPASAWMLVGVASAALWITEQLEPWVVGLQASAILVSLLRRDKPFAWQRSPLALNLGMVGIVAVTVGVALRGGPSTIALAHFAALTQGLQLLDARPRHTEFLLVALALFQVLLAANLTDSVFFPPLLVAFVFATVWTLIVHTLRTEAIEAGRPQGVHRAITPGLLRTVLVASGLSVLLGLLLFPVLPRLRSSVVTSAALHPQLPTSGFSDRVQLGELGRIRSDPTLVMRIETLEGTPPPPGGGYWRGLAFDHFDGASWSITPPQRVPVAGSPESGVTLGRDPGDVDLVQRIVREPVEAGVLFGAGEVRQLQGTVRRMERDTSGGLYAVGQADERVRYRVATKRRRVDEAALRDDVARPLRPLDRRYLQLPELSPAVAQLAREITAGAHSDAERVRALERFLLGNGRYTNDPPDVDPRAPGSAIEAFLLGELAGHCEYFASAMVVLARSLGLPARLVNGFAGGRENDIGGFLEITRSDAHTWVEVHYARAGWLPYDPTPADLRARPVLAASLSERMRQLASAVELWWFQSVVGFDRSDQVRALRRAWLAWRGMQSGARTRAEVRISKGAPSLAPPLRGVLPWLALCAAAVALVSRRRRGARRGSLPPSYARALRLLARRGLRRSPETTARDFARRVRGAQPPAVAAAFEALTEAYLAERFGPGAAPGGGEAALRTLRAALRAAS
jgi:transglutaminase-like putative cysteine protease